MGERVRGEKRRERRTWVRAAGACSVLLALAVAALVLLVPGLSPSRERTASNTRSAQHPSGATHTGSLPDRFEASFRRGFDKVANDLCQRALSSSTCDVRQFSVLPEDEREGELERGFLETRGPVAAWLASIDVLPDFPAAHRAWAVRFLADQARGPRRPFTTLVVLEVIRLVPELAGPGLLHELATGAWSQTVRFAALEALAAGPRPEDVPFLRGLLDAADTRESRRALRALARSDRGAPLLASWLRDHVDDMPEGLTRDLALSLQRSGGVMDARLAADLLRSRQPAVVQAVLRSLRSAAGVEDEPLPADLVAPVAALTTADDPKTRRDAIAALASLGDGGLAALRSIAEEQSRPPRERIQAAGSLLDLAPEVAGALSAGLVRSASNAQEAYRAAQLGAASPSALTGVMAEIRRWMTTHPDEAARLVDLIEYGTEAALIERAGELRGQTRGGT